MSGEERQAEETQSDGYRWKILQRQVQERRVGRIFAVLNERRIEAVLIKGWAAARNYPKPFDRVSVDADVAVRPEQFELCEKILRAAKVTGYDLHGGLRHLDTTAWDDLYARSERVQIGGAPVRILCAEDHLRVLCVHWLGDGGADRERLWDVYYAVARRPADFDWRRCLDAVGANRRKWIVCAVGLAEKYLGLDLRDTPIADEAKNLPVWLVETVEREWKRGARLKPLYVCLRERKGLYEQIKLRIPPNAIQATVEAEGAFDEGARFPYQIESLARRAFPALKRIVRMLRGE